MSKKVKNMALNNVLMTQTGQKIKQITHLDVSQFHGVK